MEIPVCKVPKKFDISIRIISNNEGIRCYATDYKTCRGTYSSFNNAECLKYSPNIKAVFAIVIQAIIETFLMLRSKK